MTVMHEVEFGYEIGEEVVFHLPSGADAGQPAPGWMIGEIVERVVSEGRPRYTVRFADGDATRAIQVSESEIEGTA